MSTWEEILAHLQHFTNSLLWWETNIPVKKGCVYVALRSIGLHSSTKKCIVSLITISPNRVLIHTMKTKLCFNVISNEIAVTYSTAS